MQSNVNVPDMSHLEVINKIIGKKGYKTYLEIGLKDGHCFFNVKAPRKAGVEPEISYLLALNNVVSRELQKLNGGVPDTEIIIPVIYKMTSDEFFKKNRDFFDIIFIDGLHTRKQVYRDIENSLKVLNEGGLILVHDTNPMNKIVANPNAPIVAEWSGDVWRAIVELQCNEDNINLFTLDIPFGLTVIKKQENPELIKPRYMDISFEEFENDRKFLLNLKPLSYLDEIIK